MFYIQLDDPLVAHMLLIILKCSLARHTVREELDLVYHNCLLGCRYPTLSELNKQEVGIMYA